MAEQGGGGGMQGQIEGPVHGTEVRRLTPLVRAPGDLALLGLIQLAGGEPLWLPFAQRQPSPRLPIALPA